MNLSRISVQVEVEVHPQRLTDLLCGALEGGSNYWYMIENFDKHDVDTGEQVEYMHEAPMAGGWIEFSACGDDGDYGQFSYGGCNRFRLDWAGMKTGLKVMASKYPEHMAIFLDENDDAETSDVYLQCCLFGELVFG